MRPTNCTGEPISAITTLTRLTFKAPDGTETELRDVLTDGKPNLVTVGDPCTGQSVPPGFNRGTVFVSSDGSSMKFVSDAPITDATGAWITTMNPPPSGNLMFRDGTLYRIDQGLVSFIRDRNGNKTTFTYDTQFDFTHNRVTQIIDSLNRAINITYGCQSGPPCADDISFPGTGGVIRHITVFYQNLSQTLDPNPSRGFSMKARSQLFPLQDLLTNEPYDPVVVAFVQLPNLRNYGLLYDPYADLAKVILPTGGGYEYDFGGGYDNSTTSSGISPQSYVIYRRLLKRRTYSIGSTLQGSDEFIAARTPGPQPEYGGQTAVTVNHKDSVGNIIASETHTYFGDPGAELSPFLPARSYAPWTEGREFQTTTPGLRSATQTLTQRQHSPWWSSTNSPCIPINGEPYPCTADTEPTEDPRITQTDTTLLDVSPNLISRQTFAYDQFNNRTDVTDFDYGQGAPGPLLRQEHTDFVTDPNYTSGSVYLPSLPLVERTYFGTTTYAQNQYEYDIYSGSGTCSNSFSQPVLNAPQHGPICTQPSILQMDSAYAFGGVTQRGNVTQIQRYLNTGPNATTYHQYDVAGNMVRSIDARGNQAEIDYDSNNNTYAFRSRVVDALAHATRISWDTNTGKPTLLTDANGRATQAFYSDSLDRLTQISYPDNGTTSYSYNDAANTVTTTTAQNSCGSGASVQSDIVYDGLGRKKQTDLLTDSGGAVTSTTTYDALGRVFQVSNPFRSGDQQYFTTTTYDALSRPNGVTSPDGTHVSYQYAGNQTTTSENACNVGVLNNCVLEQTSRRIDALGRLTFVQEANGLQTFYSYDPTGNLTNVNQSGQTRTFGYDTLSRLTSAINPENGTTNYGYDPNGNVTSIAEGGVTRFMSYDPINRIQSRTYSDYSGSDIAHTTTPAVTYTYDQGFNGIGHLTNVTNGASTTSFLSFDAMGRVTASSQSTGSVSPGQFTYAYNLAGGLETETFPSGRIATTCYDGASHVANVTGKASSTSAAVTYATGPSTSNIHYTAHGAIDQLKLGNGLFEQTIFNPRLQVSTITLGTSLGSSNVWSMGNVFPPPGYNNGNILSQGINATGMTTVSQTYLYDSVNRLTLATENPASGASCPDASSHWCELFSYDSYGNRSMTQSTNTGIVAPINFSPSTNQITDSGWGYDHSGNLNRDFGASLTYKYDAENRMVASCAYSDGPATCTNVAAAARTLYGYDGDGRRVTKQTPSGTLTTFIYDASGELAAEYGPSSAPAGTEFLTADYLGSTRVVTNSAQLVVARHDFRPFGDEIPGTGVRQGIVGYSQDGGVRQQFTSKERDAETGLDFFEARYYSSPQGRFTSPDEFKGGIVDPFTGLDIETNTALPYADITDPQTLNKYGYVRNNPLRYTDPTGHCIFVGLDTLACVAAITATAAAAAGAIYYGKKLGEAIRDYLDDNSRETIVNAPPIPASPPPSTATDTPIQTSQDSSTLQPGPYAGGSIPARGPQRDFTPGERGQINDIGNTTGCHTCGTTNPGTKSGNFVPDHQPPSAVNTNNAPQRLYPQCLNCSRQQGGETRQTQRTQPPPPARPVKKPARPVKKPEDGGN